MAKEQDILLDEFDDLLIRDNDLAIGDSLDQEVGIVLRLKQGELKSDPILGPNLIELIKSNATPAEIKNKAKLHLQRDGKNYNEIKNQIISKING